VPLFKALKHLTCEGKEYAPGEVMPGAVSFPNWRELLEWRYIGYATDDEIKAYETKIIAEKKEVEEAAKKVTDEKVKADAAVKAVKEVEEAAKNKK
jgi:hypothetical protein